MRRALILVAPLALLLPLGACSDDDDDDTPADTATASTKPETTEGDVVPDVSVPDITPPDISLPDISLPDITLPDLSLPENADELLGEVFPGLDDEQIDCLVENLSGEFDLGAVSNLLDECNIDPQDLLPGD